MDICAAETYHTNILCMLVVYNTTYIWFSCPYRKLVFIFHAGQQCVQCLLLRHVKEPE